MKLIDFISNHFDSMKQDQRDNFKYGLGVRIYLISEYNFDDYIPAEYISDLIKCKNEFPLFKSITNRFELNNQAKKIFKGDFKFEHMISKKYIIEDFYKCNSPQEFEKVIRNKLTHAFITKEEEKRLPRLRKTLEEALDKYKNANINIERFYFNK